MTDFDDRRAGLPPPRFSLAALMCAIASLAALFATMSYVGTHAAVLLLLFAVAVFAHVAGNALGTKLRASGDRPISADGTPRQTSAFRPTRARDFAPTTRLSKRQTLGWPTLIATVAGFAIGGCLGGYGLALVIPRVTPQTVALAICASAVLGGIWSFLAASFIQVAWGAASQASREPSSAASEAKR